MGRYEDQRTFLLGLIGREEQDENYLTTFRYYLPLDGQRLEVCHKSFMDVFQIKRGTVKELQDRLNQGQIRVTDGRGKHENRIRVAPEVKDLILQHIRAFPAYQTHYSRHRTEFYLSPELNLARMFEMFLSMHPNVPNLQTKQQLYRNTFRQTGLKIGQPKSDTCKQCDRLHMKTLSAENDAVRIEAEQQHHQHLVTADEAYRNLTNDIIRSTNDPTYVVKCGDLQKVLFSPALTHADMFYKRQLSSYNYCLFDGATSTGLMCFWSEIVGKRGVDEVGSCLLANIQDTLEPLANGQNRTLVFWSDRCRGQVNNWPMICLFKFLIRQKYFTTIEQKFLTSGHTFLPCDRLFALIEKRRDRCQVTLPQDWIRVIQETRTQNPFPIQEMTQNNILDIKALAARVPRPVNFLITECSWIRMTSNDPSLLLWRTSFNPEVWSMSRLFGPNQRGLIINRIPWINANFNHFRLTRKYRNPLPISLEKYNDLMSMMAFIRPEFRDFYINITVQT